MRVAWALGPATTVVLARSPAWLHAAAKIGRQRAALILRLGFAISLGPELSGTGTGLPVRAVSRTAGCSDSECGGLVPFNIPDVGFFMLYCALAIVRAALRPTGRRAEQAVCGRSPAASCSPRGTCRWTRRWCDAHWLWHLAAAAEQTALQRIFVSDIFYGCRSPTGSAGCSRAPWSRA
jgi:hypothetical protein